MKVLIKTTLFALAISLIVYGTVYKLAYQELLAHQADTGHIPYSPDVPASSPSSAWLDALPPAALTFLAVFGLVVRLRNAGKRSRH